MIRVYTGLTILAETFANAVQAENIGRQINLNLVGDGLPKISWEVLQPSPDDENCFLELTTSDAKHGMENHDTLVLEGQGGHIRLQVLPDEGEETDETYEITTLEQGTDQETGLNPFPIPDILMKSLVSHRYSLPGLEE